MIKQIGSLALLVPCHRKPDRCLKINGRVMPLCARCFGMLSGYLAIPPLFLVAFPWWLGMALQIPMVVDGLTQRRGMRESTNLLRVLTGLGSGIGISMVVVAFVRGVTGI